MRDDEFRSSSFCSNDTCLGVGLDGADVLVADMSRPDVRLRVTREEWAAFVSGVKAGEFDLD